MQEKPFLRPLLSFLPLLVIYTVIVLLFSSNELRPDENRYLEYATNLTQGFYADTDNPEIWSGPGYPLVITPFVLAKAPFIAIQLLNVVFLIGAVVFLFKTLSMYFKPRQSIVICYLFGLYPPMLRYMVFIYTESFAILCTCGFLYYAIKLHKQASNKLQNSLISGLFLGLLVLTRVTFGYVITFALILYLVVYLFKKSKKIYHTLIILFSGFVLCVPFLIYTYSVTGQFFSWGTNGGAVLYWHSTPFENEYGDWISPTVVIDPDKEHPYYDTSKVIENHYAFIHEVENPSHSAVQKDNLYKEKAFKNMKQYPMEYLKNTGASALRLFFEYPISYKTQSMKTYLYLLPNIFLVVFLILAAYVSLRKIRLIPMDIRFIAIISLFYIGILILLTGRVRHLLPIVPLLVFYISFILERFTKFEITNGLNEDNLNIQITRNE